MPALAGPSIDGMPQQCCDGLPSATPNGRIAQRGDDLRDMATASLGAAFVKRHSAHPRGFVLSVRMPAHEHQPLLGCRPLGA